MPIDLVGTSMPHLVRETIATWALMTFSERVWVSWRSIPKRFWFLIPWAVLLILTFAAQP